MSAAASWRASRARSRIRRVIPLAIMTQYSNPMRRYLFFPLLFVVVQAADWKKEAIFRATFDGSPAAQTAGGDKTIYSAANYKEPGKAGLEGSGVEHAKGAGRKGDALKFPVKNTKAVYFKALNNVNPKEGTISFWLKLDPDQDLA